jgi:RNA polymerase sigma-70 factor, ECF subfamily
MGNSHNNQKELIERICVETWKELYRFIYYKVQNREEAEDITQETYVKALSYLERSKIEVLDYRNFLKTISMNIIRDLWRSKKRKGSSINLDEVDPEAIATEDFSDMVSNRAVIEKAMQRLTKEQQTAISLRIIKGYSVAETAKLMKKKEGTIRVLQYRAIKALTEILKETQEREELML